MNILIHGANATLPSPPPPYKPESKFIRINVLWFISLSLSLTTVLVGTLCMQWLREYRHYDSLTHRDALLLRQMRYEGLLRWKVLTIISLLPTLLQSAFVLFFAGILQLLWTTNATVTIAVAIAIAFALLFMLLTTIAPAFQYLADHREETAHPSTAQCPYKSPQSWAVLQVIIQTTIAMHHMKQWLRSLYYYDDIMTAKSDFSRSIVLARNWFRFDLTWNRKRRSYVNMCGKVPTPVNHDMVSSLRWVATTFVENMDAAQAVYQCLRQLDPVHAMATLSKIEHDDFSFLYQMLHTTSFTILTREGKPMLVDQTSSLILEHIVRENPQFEPLLLNHRVELYTRSKAESMRLSCAGLPGMKCPDLSRLHYLLPDGMFFPASLL